MKKFVITEEEKERISSLYNLQNVTINLNEEVTDFNSTDADKYFKTRSLQIMEYPEKIPTVTGFEQNVVRAVTDGIAEGVKGVGRDTEQLSYLISKGFATFPNSVEICKKYKNEKGESLLDAVEGEWFSGGIKENIQNRIANSMKNWCSQPDNSKNGLCVIKSENELKYGI
jgi:hypothetical protein